MHRRRALSVLALALVPAAAGAQGAKVRRVGFISGGFASLYYDAFRAGMADLGYVEGKTVVFHTRLGESPDELAAALINERPDLIVAAGGAAVRSVRAVPHALPVVFSFSGDPVAAGFVKSLAQPGHNISGISLMSLELVGKRMELLRESVPNLRKVAILANAEHPGEQLERSTSIASAKALGLEYEYFQVQKAHELDAALAGIVKSGAEAMVVFPDALTVGNRQRIADVALKARIAAISGWAEFADSGFLISYGPNLRVSYRRLATFADKVLKGAKVGTLPVERPSVVEMVYNARTAHALGREVPKAVVARADRVLQ
jgi:putative ABC transport system substrate-binding protein